MAACGRLNKEGNFEVKATAGGTLLGGEGFLIFDMGGGTLDVSLLTIEDEIAFATRQLVAFVGMLFIYVVFLYSLLYRPGTKELCGFNVFCDVQGTPTLCFSPAPRFCRTLRNIERIFVKEDMDQVLFKLAEAEYMQRVDISIVWFCVCIVMVSCTWLLALRRCMPQIVRTFIMLENISSFWTAPRTSFCTHRWALRAPCRSRRVLLRSSRASETSSSSAWSMSRYSKHRLLLVQLPTVMIKY